MPVSKSEIYLSSTKFVVFFILLCNIHNLEARNRVFNEPSAIGGNLGEEEYSKKEIEPRYFVPIRFGTVVPARTTTLPPCATPANCCRTLCEGECTTPVGPPLMRCAMAGTTQPGPGMPCYLTTTCPECIAVTCPTTGPVPPSRTSICPTPTGTQKLCP